MKHESCGQLLGELSAYLDGDASDAICAEIERHLSDCGDCRAVVDTLRKTVTLYRELPQPKLTQDARRRLYKNLDLEDYLARKSYRSDDQVGAMQP